MTEHQFEILKTPGELDLLFSMMRGMRVTFTVRNKETGNVGGWKVQVMSLGFSSPEDQEDKVLQISGRIDQGRFRGVIKMNDNRKGHAVLTTFD